MSRSMKRRRERVPGLPPGTLNLTTDPELAHCISVIKYNAQSIECEDVIQSDKLELKKENGVVTWLRIKEIHKSHVVRSIGALYQLHPLILEDILNSGQRPKINIFDDIVFIVVKIPSLEENGQEFNEKQLSLVLGRDYLLTFQEDSEDLFAPVYERLNQKLGRIRQKNADYLTYAILDLVVDLFFTVIEAIEDKLETFEELFTASDSPPDLIMGLYEQKRMVLKIRKAIIPTRELIRMLERRESDLIAPDTVVYLRDAYEHTVQIIEAVETDRETLMTLHDVYLSTISNKMNQVMKVLTIFASIFIPLTFFAGLYGMNFKHMPELEFAWAYPVFLCLMVMMSLAMLFYFRRKGWIGRPGKKSSRERQAKIVQAEPKL